MRVEKQGELGLFVFLLHVSSNVHVCSSLRVSSSDIVSSSEHVRSFKHVNRCAYERIDLLV